MHKVKDVADCPAKRFALNVQRLRIQKFGSVVKACAASGISAPRWYRMEQGRHPGILGDLLDTMSALFEVTPESLVKPVKLSRKKDPKNGKAKSAAGGKRTRTVSDRTKARPEAGDR